MSETAAAADRDGDTPTSSAAAATRTSGRPLGESDETRAEYYIVRTEAVRRPSHLTQ